MLVSGTDSSPLDQTSAGPVGLSSWDPQWLSSGALYRFIWRVGRFLFVDFYGMNWSRRWIPLNDFYSVFVVFRLAFCHINEVQ